MAPSLPKPRGGRTALAGERAGRRTWWRSGMAMHAHLAVDCQSATAALNRHCSPELWVYAILAK
jgi:hypothetical protein